MLIRGGGGGGGGGGGCGRVVFVMVAMDVVVVVSAMMIAMVAGVASGRTWGEGDNTSDLRRFFALSGLRVG